MNSAWVLPVYGVTIAVVVALAARRRMNLILAYFALVPFFGLIVDVGLNVNIERFIAVGILLDLLRGRRKGNNSVFMPAFCIYAFAVTLVGVLQLPALAREYSWVRGEGRWIFQLVMWGLSLAPAAYLGRNGESSVLEEAPRVFVAMVTLLALGGLVQFAIYSTSGVDIFPIGMLNEAAVQRSATLDLSGTALDTNAGLRVCSLGGEPKHLAYSIVIALDLVLIDYVTGGMLRLPQWSRRLGAVVLGATLLLTFSTQGYLLLALDVALVGGVALTLRSSASAKRTVLGLAALAAIAGGGRYVPGLNAIIEGRTVGRLEETRGIEDMNEAVLSWLGDHPEQIPFGVGLGNVHLHARPYVPADYFFYMKESVFVAKSGALRLVSEVGVVGLVLFLLMWWWPLRSLWRPGEDLLRRRAYGMAGAVVLLNFLIAADGPLYVFMFMGLVQLAANVLGKSVASTSEHVPSLAL